MEKKFLVLSVVIFSLLIFGIGSVWAVDAQTADEWKQVIQSDQAEIKEERIQIKEDALAGKTEEMELRRQIQVASDAGDQITAEKLKEQLKAMHKENVQERIEDKKELQSDIRELKTDVKDAHQEGYLRRKFDKDNNPPGPIGGAGTNWENPPGPKGGSGASPNRRKY